MARLPSDRYLMQDIGGKVMLFEDGTERELMRCDPGDQDDVVRARAAIDDAGLGDEDRTFAHFWLGYFARYAGYPEPRDGLAVLDQGKVSVGVAGLPAPVVTFDPSDQDAAAKAQFAIFSSPLAEQDKTLAYFWSGYFYASAA